MLNEEYISRKDALDILGLYDTTFLKFEKQFKLEFRWAANHSKTYKKEDILFFKEQQNQIGKQYVPISWAKEMFADRIDPNDAYIWTKKIISIPPPLFCLNKKILKRNERLCDIEEVEKILEEMLLKQDINNISSDDIGKTFKMRLSMREDKIPVLNESVYTKNKWIRFVNFKLTSSKSGNGLLEERMSLFLRTTFLIEEKMEQVGIKELYELTTRQINTWLIAVKGKLYRQYLYEFFRAINHDIQTRLQDEKTQEITAGFVFKNIVKYNDLRFRNKNNARKDFDGLYDVNTYIGMFKYLTNISFHMNRIINNGIDTTYLSTWLYCLLHLNNGWRRGDIMAFPRLYLADVLNELEIKSANWFLKNEIGMEKSRKIISRITQFDFMVAKTDLKNHFFCSDKLAPSISTALLLFEIYYICMSMDYCPEYKQPLMKFNDKKNVPSTNMLRKLFNEFKAEGFAFKSKKMNKTVLTLVYDVACTMSPSGYNELILPQYMRAHKAESSTIQYIEFSSEQLEFLSGELFERGSFGFVINSLLGHITKSNGTERTKEIYFIKKLFGDYNKIEATVGMLNYFHDDENEVMEIIKKYSLEEGIELVTNIYLNNLPAKEDHVQCLHSGRGCRNPDGKCIGCKYSIPSIYVLYTLGNKIMNDMNEYLYTKIAYKKIKLSSQIYESMNILTQAIRRYGKDYVYNCADIDRNEFIITFSKISEIQALMKSL